MKNKLITYSVILIVSQLFFSCKKDECKVAVYENAEKHLQEIDFQGSVLIQKGNEEILRQSFGMADVENNIPNEINTKFRIGSMSKAFTVLGIVRLKEEGLITSFDQSIQDFVDDFPYGDEITLSHLMRHTSGLPDHVSTFEDLIIDQNLFFTPEDMFEIIGESIADDGLQFTPGSARQYSNSNFLLLALLIESLSGETYHEYLSHSLQALNMNDTYKGNNLITNPNEAQGYNNGVQVGEYPMEIAFGSGDWVSNITDLEIWANAWMTDLISDAIKAEVFAQPIQDEITEFGMGWFTIRTHGKLAYFHGGDIDGFTSLIVLYPESDGMFIALSNKQNQRNQLDQMIDVFAKNEF